MNWLGVITFMMTVTAAESFAISDSLTRPTPTTWYFGEGLNTGDEFSFEICDYILRVPYSDDPCYNIMLRFVALLQDREEKVWVVSAHVDHDTTTDMIFRISENTHKIKTDGVNTQYAESIERTLGWIRSFANQGRPQILDVGRSWGVVAAPESTEIIVNKVEFVEADGTLNRVYLLRYAQGSYLHIKDEFPFPLKAAAYRPMSSDAPSFAFQMISHNHTETCNAIAPIHKVDMIQANPVESISSQNALIENPNNTEIHEFTIDEILRFDKNSTVEQLLKERYADDYKLKMAQTLYNFTKFIEIISEAANTALENQLNSSNK